VAAQPVREKPAYSKPYQPKANAAFQREDRPNKPGQSFRRGKNARIAAGLFPRGESKPGAPQGKPGADGFQPRRRKANAS
jgi:hypothetical protein